MVDVFVDEYSAVKAEEEWNSVKMNLMQREYDTGIELSPTLMKKLDTETNEIFQELQKAKKIKKQKENFGFEFVWEKDLDSYEGAKCDWIVQSLIPAKSLGVWTGKRGSFKSFLNMDCAFAVARGEAFLGKYETKKSKVCYLDRENGAGILKVRKNSIRKGQNIEDNSDIAFICFSHIRLDREKDVQELEKFIKKEKIGLLVVDTYRRVIGFDENDAGAVSELFVDILRPLCERNNLSIILIHHDRKGTGVDEMDEIRGSSDLANYCDFILKNERKGKQIILKQLKCRYAPEINPIEVLVESNDTDWIRFSSSGEYHPRTAETSAVETLLLWIAEKKITEFETKDAWAVAEKENVKRSNFYEALRDLQQQGIIRNAEKGKYLVVQVQNPRGVDFGLSCPTSPSSPNGLNKQNTKEAEVWPEYENE